MNSFSWPQILTVAESLVGDRPLEEVDEATLRTVISRSYYAAFNTARRHFEVKEGIDFGTTRDVHNTVIKVVRRGKYSRLGSKLDTLRWTRNRVDYDDRLEDMALVQAARRSLDDAKTIIASLSLS